MAEFERAFPIESRQQFIDARLAKLRGIGEAAGWRGDSYWLARQHAYFMQSYAECKCLNHSCSGCAITLGVATALEDDIAKLDQTRCDQEEAKAVSIWELAWGKVKRKIYAITVLAKKLEKDREADAARAAESQRAQTRRRDWHEDKES